MTGSPDPTRDWHPIETAPKDGQHILVYFPQIGIWEVLWSTEAFDDGFWCVSDNKTEDRPLRGWTDAPTHWMPLPAGPGAAPRPASLQVAQDALVAAVDRLIEAERLYDMAEGEHAIEDAERDIESRDEPIIEAARCYVSTLRAAPVEAPQPRRQTQNEESQARVDLSTHEQATGSTAPTNEPRSNFYKLWMACRIVLNELEAFDIAEDTVRWFDERQLLSHALERARAEVFAVDPVPANVGKAPLRATESSPSPAVTVVAASPDITSYESDHRRCRELLESQGIHGSESISEGLIDLIDRLDEAAESPGRPAARRRRHGRDFLLR